MKKILIFSLSLVLTFSLMAPALAADGENLEEQVSHIESQIRELEAVQEHAHTMADCARNLGLGEDCTVIELAKSYWHDAADKRRELEQQLQVLEDKLEEERAQEAEKPSYSEEDLLLVAKIIQAEAGSSWLSDEHQLLVGNVLLNRVASPEFPNTIKDCLYQKGQYYPESSTYFKNIVPSERAMKNARRLMDGERFCPADVVFQANFKQGGGVYKAIPDKYLKTTYFCYSEHRELY